MVFTRVALCSIKVEHSTLVITIAISSQSIMVPLTVSHGSYPYIHTYCSEKSMRIHSMCRALVHVNIKALFNNIWTDSYHLLHLFQDKLPTINISSYIVH